MAQTYRRHLRLEALGADLAGRLGREDLLQRRAIEAELAGRARPRRFKDRAAFLHILDDVLEILVRQDAKMLEPIEDDQIEFAQLDIEQLVDREGDQRQDRKSTRLNSSHSQISYAVFCLKKKKNNTNS